jgi:hypothetical protein
MPHQNISVEFAEVAISRADGGSNGVRLPVERVFLDVVCGASMASINVFNEAIDKSMGLSCKEANGGVVPDFCEEPPERFSRNTKKT